MGQELESLQRRYGDIIDQAIKQSLDVQAGPIPFVDMMRYQLGYVDEQRRTSQASGGKRFRPALCLLACEAAGGQEADALRAAAAIELLHNFSLIHDDIEDGDPARRHRPTLWKVWGVPHAINAGDGMFALASHTLVQMYENGNLAVDLARAFHQTTLELTEGQYLDMSFESKAHVSTNQYLGMITLKTASLISLALWTGGRIAGADGQSCNALQQFGLCIGRSFQIYDDIQGIWGAREQTGKEANKDLINRKKTLPVLIAWQRATPEQAQRLDQFFARSEHDVSTVHNILEATDAKRRSFDEGERYLKEGLDALCGARLLPPFRQTLERTAAEITGH